MSNQLNGGTYDAPTTLNVRPFANAVTYAEAGAAIPVGSPLMPDTSDATGKEVIVCTAALSQYCIGVYEGIGGTGAAATVTGTSGFAAASGDIIQFRYKGPVMGALVDGGTTDVAANDFMQVSAAGFDTDAELSASENLKGIAIGWAQTNTTQGSLVWLT